MSVLGIVNLLLPALFPSWRFFDVIGPSPRIELCQFDTPQDDLPEHDQTVWRECRQRPAHVGFRGMLKDFFWNAAWNESLHLANCAERIIQGQTEHCSREIRLRLRADLLRDADIETLPAFFRFRLVFVSQAEDRLRRDILFVSPTYRSVDPLDQ